jgi:hypothetical protein
MVDLPFAAIAVFTGSIVVTILLLYEIPLSVLSGLVLKALGVYASSGCDKGGRITRRPS